MIFGLEMARLALTGEAAKFMFSAEAVARMRALRLAGESVEAIAGQYATKVETIESITQYVMLWSKEH